MRARMVISEETSAYVLRSGRQVSEHKKIVPDKAPFLTTRRSKAASLQDPSLRHLRISFHEPTAPESPHTPVPTKPSEEENSNLFKVEPPF